MAPELWLIGGSDSAALAGIQADLRVAQSLGINAATVVTAVTAQNSTTVTKLEAVSPDLLTAQLDALAVDGLPKVIKIGLLCDEASAKTLADWLAEARQRQSIYVICDPVLSASSGDALSGAELVHCLDRYLLPQVDLLTPNLDEWAALRAGRAVNVTDDPLNDYLAWQRPGDPDLLIKGGHGQGADVVDYWLRDQQCQSFRHPRLDVAQVRGTGCALATALAVYRTRGYVPEDAITLALSYMQGALNSNTPVNDRISRLGSAPLWPDVWQLPAPMEPWRKPDRPFASIDKGELGLYPVVDSIEWVERLIDWGVRTVQLRIKSDLTPEHERALVPLIVRAREAGVKLFINDHWQLAIRLGAYGVHLGQEDLEIADLNAIAEAGLRLGVSTHGYFEIARVLSIKPSYIALGHIFPTQTKDMPSAPQGLERLKQYVSLLKGQIPTVAIGGISLERAPQVLATGVDSVALVSAITQSSAPETVTDQLLSLFSDREDN